MEQISDRRLAQMWPSFEPGTLGDHLLRRFAGASSEFARTGNRNRRLISRAAICEFYAVRLGQARTCGELRGIAHDQVLDWLNRRGALVRGKRAALTKALYDVRRKVNDDTIELRTTGTLVIKHIPPDTRLDAKPPVRDLGPAVRAAEGASRYAIPAGTALALSAIVMDAQVRLDPPIPLRDGARVTVFADAGDVLPPRPTVRPLPPGALSSLIGVASLGGDALVDSERWEDVD